MKKLLSDRDDVSSIAGLESRNSNIEKYEFAFEMVFDETYEENLVYTELWINMGSYSDGTLFGRKGVGGRCLWIYFYIKTAPW
ncbi:hypothetical protein [Melghirimyces algeriensis]|uniref:Uncharacterized protein n=1 Tax=Melghirimyces algeriensis TaxID=910412 RepID=A0A521E7B8_9BACL|nr:hypothetical protein [Melghirimyces algeriensis]SMO79762.1 hypothetical protein SAMN06264849_10854 [Melghirimyces algeriensis]